MTDPASQQQPRWTEYVPLDDVRPDPRNPKAHAEAEIAASMGRWGYTLPMQIDERTGLLVSGHGRRLVLLQLRAEGQDPPEGVTVDADGRWLVPLTRGWSSSDDVEAAGYLATDNYLAELGGWEQDPLGRLLADVAGSDLGLIGTGRDAREVDDFLAGLSRPDPQPDAPDPAPPRERTQQGLHTVALLMQGDTFREYAALLAQLRKAYGMDDAPAVVVEAMRRAAEAS